MKRCLALLVCCSTIATQAPTATAGPEETVVKVFAAIRFPNPTQPWAKVPPAPTTGTGVIIEGKRILTNAHLVEYGTEVTVQHGQGGEKVDATVQALNLEVDLAILTVKDEKFFGNRKVLSRVADLPRVQDRVAIYGFPIGGNALSITKGEVSRIEYRFYGRGIGPIIQVSAPINPGNSGGPAVVDGKMIGLVVSRLLNAQNIGEVIPNEEIETFLESIKRGGQGGKATLASKLLVQKLENKALRRKLKVDDEVRGLFVQLASPNKVNSPVKTFDVLTKIGEFPIDNSGQVQLKNGMSAYFVYLIPKLARGDAEIGRAHV